MSNQIQIDGINVRQIEPVVAVIPSVFFSQKELLGSIIQLYGTIEADVTWSKGKFWDGLPAPSLRSDLQDTGDVVADFRSLPYRSRSIRSMIIDPPFLHDSGESAGVITERFSSYRTQADLRVAYHGGLVEARRVLIRSGVLVFKCQDIVEHDRNVWNHCHVWQMAINCGFEAVDLFILLNQHQMIGFNHTKQVHARKAHCYFWVFRKSKGQHP